jgi:hypothetical protein
MSSLHVKYRRDRNVGSAVSAAFVSSCTVFPPYLEVRPPLQKPDFWSEARTRPERTDSGETTVANHLGPIFTALEAGDDPVNRNFLFHRWIGILPAGDWKRGLRRKMVIYMTTFAPLNGSSGRGAFLGLEIEPEVEPAKA